MTKSTTSRLRSATMMALAIAATIAATFVAIYATQLMPHRAASGWHTPAFAVPLHLLTTIPALPLGLYVLVQRKGDARHVLLGRIWGMLMMITALDSLLIRDLTGGLGPIHIFSFVTLVTIPLGVWQVRRGNIAAHRRAMIGNYIGLIVAGGFALAPGRMLGNLIFG